MPWFAAALLLAPQQPAFVVHNPSAVPRRETLRVSMPLPQGRWRKLGTARIAGHAAPLVPLVHWGDGSVAVVQIQPRLELAPRQRRRVLVELSDEEARPGEVAAPPPVPRVHTELEDPWGTVYRADLLPDPTAGPNGVLSATPHVVVQRLVGSHRAGSRTFFGLVGYLVNLDRRVELTLSLDNGAHHDAPVLGPARFRAFRLVVDDPNLRIRPRFARENHLPLPHRHHGSWIQDLLGPSLQLYLGDATAKTWRFDLYRDHPDAPPGETEAVRLSVEQPLVALPELAWTRSTGAFGTHGGPAPGPGEPTSTVNEIALAWRTSGEFGPFGDFGDARDAAANGTPRNGPCALHNVLRFAAPELLRSAEGMVLQQSLRPTPGQPVRTPVAAAALRQRMSVRAMQRPHGFTALDYEHFSVDLLFDYYWLTGDPYAHRELRRAGIGLRRVLHDLPMQTCRGEGWCMQAAVAIERAGAARGLVAWLRTRFANEVRPHLGRDRDRFVLAQPPHPDAFDGRTRFDCPWQMAAFVHGAHAMFRHCGDAQLRDAAVRAAAVMAGPGWLDDVGPKYFVTASALGEDCMPIGHGPLEGTAVLQIGGFVLAAELATDHAQRTLFRTRAQIIVAPHRKSDLERTAANPWFQLALDRWAVR